MSDMRLRLEDDTFYYPDVMVVREPLESENPTFQREPCLLVEVTSPSTETTDRREKLAAYKAIPTLKAYLIVSQERRTSSSRRTASGYNTIGATRTARGSAETSWTKDGFLCPARRTPRSRWRTSTRASPRYSTLTRLLMRYCSTS